MIEEAVTLPAWRLCGALRTLRIAVDSYAPGRNTASDGTIGDAAHAARESDHNPHLYNGAEWVAAMDITNDPVHGMSGHWLAESLRLSRDPRIKYVIWDNQIMQSLGMAPWQWTRYTGPDPHVSHVHVSVLLTPESTIGHGEWLLPIFHSFKLQPMLSLGSRSIDVRTVQCILRVITDGIFGPITEAAVKQYQVHVGLLVDGIVGPKTWASLRQYYR